MTATATYDPAEVERLIKQARDTEYPMSVPSYRAMADQLEAARARIAELEGALLAACDLGEPMRGAEDPRLAAPHRVELLPMVTTGRTREEIHAAWAALREVAGKR